MAKDVLDAHLGKRFPNLTLLDEHGAAVQLDKVRVGRTAVLFACCPSAESVRWMQELEARNWTPPAGYDRLIVLAMGFGERVFDGLVLRKAPSSFFVGVPLQDYLTAVRVALAFPRFRGHYLKGGYDVPNAKTRFRATSSARVLSRVQDRCGSLGLG
jgi:hypothetical protein